MSESSMAAPSAANKNDTASNKVGINKHRNKRQKRCGAHVAEQPLLFHYKEQLNKVETTLLRVELLDKDGDVMWSCDDLRKGHYTELEKNVTTPSYEETPNCYWRKHVWTLPVQQRSIKYGRSELEICRQNQVHKVRIGMHEWKAKIGSDIGCDFDSYDEETNTIETVSLPLCVSTHKTISLDDWDELGPDGLYLTGSYTVTQPRMVSDFEEIDENGGVAWDTLRDIHSTHIFPGVHDELRVREVNLAIAGTLKKTLELFNLYDDKWIEFPESNPGERWGD